MPIGFYVATEGSFQMNRTMQSNSCSCKRNGLRAVLAIALTVGVMGCKETGSSSGLGAVSPTVAAGKAIKEYDKNSDGRLSSEELAACPGMRAGMMRYDRDKNGAVTAEEIGARIQRMQALSRSHTLFACTVRIGSQPVEGARVRFVPEAYQGAAIRPAVGTTDRDGYCDVVVDDPELDEGDRRSFGIDCGVYRVTISRPSGGVSARYGGGGSPLGVDVAIDGGRDAESVQFQLERD